MDKVWADILLKGPLCSIGASLLATMLVDPWKKKSLSVENVGGREIPQWSKVGVSRVVHTEAHMEKMSMCQRILDQCINVKNVA